MEINERKNAQPGDKIEFDEDNDNDKTNRNLNSEKLDTIDNLKTE